MAGPARAPMTPQRRVSPAPPAAAGRAPARRAGDTAGWPRQAHGFDRIALLAPGGVQAKRTGASGADACERQADQVAEQVMRAGAPHGPLPALAAPAGGAAREALTPRGSGQALAPGVRAFMESRLGHDFGRVRIHTDSNAAQAARAIDARAYAAGHDIVFAPGQFAPETAAGRGLLAHELTHVVQQARGGAVVQRKGFWGAVGGFFNSFFHLAVDYSDKAIRKYLQVLEDTHDIEGDPDSDDMARQIVRDGQHRSLSLEIRTLLVAEMLDGWTLGGDEEAIIKILRAASLAERGQIMAKLGRGQIWDKFSGRNRRVVEALTLTAADLQDPALMARLEARSESELVDYRQNVVDAAVGAALDRMLSRKRHELGSYPEAERRAISQGDPFTANATEAFSADLEAAKVQQSQGPAAPSGAAMGTRYDAGGQVEVKKLPLPPGVAIEFETRIDRSNRPGLERVARHLVHGGNLPLNLTRNLALPELRKVYRFTRFSHAGRAGATELVLIEEVGLLPPTTEVQAMGWDTRQPRPGAMAAGTTKIRTFEIRRDADWTATEWRLVTDALTDFPDSVLTEVTGVTFRRRPCEEKFIQNGVCLPSNQRTGEEAGERTSGTDGTQTITLFDDAFGSSPTRYGVATTLVSVLAHEVGHQVDLRPLDVAHDTFQTGMDRIREELDAALAVPEPPTKGKGSKKVPAGKSPHQLALDKYDADKAILQHALDQARSLSGVAWQVRNGQRSQTLAPADANGAFLKAAQADGLVLTQEQVTSGSITTYASKNIVEQFADLFAMYLTDPTLLLAIRPNVHAYFKARFPR